jgi:hypothetical protein
MQCPIFVGEVHYGGVVGVAFCDHFGLVDCFICGLWGCTKLTPCHVVRVGPHQPKMTSHWFNVLYFCVRWDR